MVGKISAINIYGAVVRYIIYFFAFTEIAAVYGKVIAPHPHTVTISCRVTRYLSTVHDKGVTINIHAGLGCRVSRYCAAVHGKVSTIHTAAIGCHVIRYLSIIAHKKIHNIYAATAACNITRYFSVAAHFKDRAVKKHAAAVAFAFVFTDSRVV